MSNLWLNKEGNKYCILFFNGWGLNENAIKHLDTDNYDICMFYDYSHIHELEFNTKVYDEVYLIAWSLGVWAASNSINPQKLRFSKTIAINGTEVPKDTKYGIHPTIFESTLKNWNPRNRDKFNLRIMGGKEEFIKMNHVLLSQSCEDQKKELECIDNELNKRFFHEIKYDSSIIGKQDLIFLPAKQINYWKNKSRTIEMEIPHYPFGSFTSWNQIINL